MIVGTKNIIDFIRLNKAPYWKIFLGGSSKGALFAKSDDENPNLPIEDSILRLNEIFNIVSPGRYYIILKQEPKDTKGIFETHFEIPTSDKVPQIGALPVQTGVSPEELAAKIAGALEAYKKEVEVENMRKELAELKRERYKPTPFENAIVKIMDAAGPQVQQLIKEMLNVKQAAAIPAVSGPQQTENKEDRQARLEKALTDLNTVFPDLDNALTDLAEFAKRDPEKARQFLPMVKSL